MRLYVKGALFLLNIFVNNLYNRNVCGRHVEIKDSKLSVLYTCYAISKRGLIFLFVIYFYHTDIVKHANRTGLNFKIFLIIQGPIVGFQNDVNYFEIIYIN